MRLHRFNNIIIIPVMLQKPKTNLEFNFIGIHYTANMIFLFLKKGKENLCILSKHINLNLVKSKTMICINQ